MELAPSVGLPEVAPVAPAYPPVRVMLQQATSGTPWWQWALLGLVLLIVLGSGFYMWVRHKTAKEFQHQETQLGIEEYNRRWQGK